MNIMELENTVYPPLKWVGGKRKIVEIIYSSISNIHSPFTYYEPFFGGGAIYFLLYSKGFIKNAHLNDVVPQVVNFYKVISNIDSRNELKKEATKIERRFNKLNIEPESRKEAYVKLRENFNDNWEYFTLNDQSTSEQKALSTKLATQFLALNKIGFNGMFRVNSKGRFNIPMGSAVKKKLFDERNFDLAGEALSKATFTCDDYSNVKPFKGVVNKNNLIFLDPPYIPNSKTAYFTDYSVEGFNKESHEKLSENFSKLISNKNNNVILTNNFNKLSIELFVDKNKNNKRLHAYKFNITKTISAKNSGRGNTEELLVSTFPIEHARLKKFNF